MELRRWPDLLPDLLRDISGRLHHAVDFVRFHAVDFVRFHPVCRPWRDSYDAMMTGTTQSFLPWLLAPNMKNHDALRLTCVFSKTSYSAPPLPARPHWVATADSGHPYASLHNPLTGVTTHVPPVPEGKEMWLSYRCPEGVHYRDGTILVYMYNTHTTSYDDLDDDDDTTKFRAALMRPGDTAWTVVERNLGALRSGHVLESRGELLWLSIHEPNLQDGCGDNIFDLLQTLVLLVYGIQEVPGSDKIQWVRKKDGKSLADRIIFLGWPYSFALDASQLGVDGGYAYFVHSGGDAGLYQWSAVFRYNLIHNKAEFVQWLTQGWRDDKSVTEREQYKMNVRFRLKKIE
ncbi:hypothetical protein ACQ4PT_060071 [Festuca glaucescens]